MTVTRQSPGAPDIKNTIPFNDAQEAWFWFIQAQAAKNDGARFAAGQGLYPRPCEPIDILRILDSLYRQRRLQMDHLKVLRHYGRRQMAPDLRRTKETRAHEIWREALTIMEPVLERKGIILPVEKTKMKSKWVETLNLVLEEA